MEVLIPPVNPALKAAPEVRGMEGEKKKKNQKTFTDLLFFPFALTTGTVSFAYVN